MSAIFYPTIVVAVIGLIAGLGLAIASIVMAVPVNKKEQDVLDALPGANCGSCGFSGCSGYAAALAKGEADTNLCSPGGADTAKKIASILGVSGGEFVKKAAVVKCLGNCDNTRTKYEYRGEKSCAAAIQLEGGPMECPYGCMGFGDCVAACEYNAIKVCNGVASVDPSSCTGCGKCVKACPKGIIELATVSEKNFVTVLCSNRDKGAQTRKQCGIGCIGCMKCVKACESGAISVNNFLASIDASKCTGCEKCVKVCVQGCIESLKSYVFDAPETDGEDEQPFTF